MQGGKSGRGRLSSCRVTAFLSSFVYYILPISYLFVSVALHLSLVVTVTSIVVIVFCISRWLSLRAGAPSLWRKENARNGWGIVDGREKAQQR
jgi:hypothetical protein